MSIGETAANGGQENISEVLANATPSGTREGFVRHTPLPWSVFPPREAGDRPGIESDTLSIVTYGAIGDDAGVNGATAAQALANAAFIVRAVNSHDDLLAALKIAQTYVDNTYLSEGDEEAVVAKQDLDFVNAAIAKAEGKAP